ncbi:HAMP domain-containing methyl-accepting chemotaxis protein [Alteromonas confluentis]|uniref:Chemotaxis protein n=1 Tax=Alteromonas confluentis TaxID=1656094 RepID=A0A1E7ZF34_9ALTE|nr:methyl-accepting chemotaxis protein [Alteromonas confluentis]OFC72090.1 chemotaxis protein [Alteromonas confluentis]
MKITVAKRIIGGFATISLLLVIISASSFINLNSVGSAVDEVNKVAVPTLTSSNALKASFLNMGRVTFEAYIEESVDGLESKYDNFTNSKANFSTELKKLETVLADDSAMLASLKQVNGAYEQYIQNVEAMYTSHRQFMEMRNAISDKIGDLEDNADDASTYLLDFSESDEVARSAALQKSAEIGSELESRLLELITVANEYAKTQTLVRADVIGNEVELIVTSVREMMNEIQGTAAGADTTGTLDEISTLVDDAIDAITGSDGALALQRSRLEYRDAAEQALSRSDANSQEGISALENLLTQADKKAAEIDEQVSFKVTSGNTIVIVVALASLAAALVIGYWTVIAITRPLNRVNELLNVASSGDLTRRLDDSAEDEFGQLAKNCNKLIGNLKSLITGINTRAEQLAAASEQTSTVTTQTTHSIQDQKSQIAQVATATTEMHSTSIVVSQSAEDTLNEIRHADSEAENVRSISLENKRTIEVLARDVEQAAEVINKLHQDSASIGGILDVIRGVADQTNLLALNAAIEAARAGEQGRGFAVVADEVRTLASRTQQSTQEINAMIEVLQAGAEKAVAVMNQGKEQTAICVEQTDNATRALDVISDAVRKAYDVSTQIEQSAREQNTVSAEISEKLESIVGIAEETTAGAQQTSQSSSEVARLAEELQQSIRQFKV